MENRYFTVHSGDRSAKHLKNVPNSIPWGLLNEHFADINHKQSLNRLNERGGMGIVEILNNIDKKRLEFRHATQEDVDRLNLIVIAYKRVNNGNLHK